MGDLPDIPKGAINAGRFPEPRAAEARARSMYELYVGPPEMTLDEVGRAYGVSRERVRQLFAKYGLEVRNPRPYRPATRKRLEQRRRHVRAASPHKGVSD